MSWGALTVQWQLSVGFEGGAEFEFFFLFMMEKESVRIMLYGKKSLYRGNLPAPFLYKTTTDTV